MSQVIVLFSLSFLLLFCNWTGLASTISVPWPRSSNISSPSEEDEKAIRPLNKRKTQNQREPDSLLYCCTGFRTSTRVKYGLHVTRNDTHCGKEQMSCSLYTKHYRRNKHATATMGNKWCIINALSVGLLWAIVSHHKLSQCITYNVQLSGILQTRSGFPIVFIIRVWITCRDHIPPSHVMI